MKIGVDIRHLTSKNLSGVGQYTLNVLKELSNANSSHEFLLFAAGRPQTISNLPKLPRNMKLVVSKTPNKVIVIKTLLGKVLESFLEEEIDMWWFPNLSIAQTKKPYIVTVHDMSFRLFPEFFTIKQRIWHELALKNNKLFRAKALIAVSSSTARDLQNIFHVPQEYIHVTPLGVAKHFQNKQKPSDANYLRDLKIKKPYILAFSTLEPRKNLETLILAFEQIKMQHDDVPDLVLAGGRGWKSKTLMQMIEKSPYKNHIHLLGFIQEKHKPALYRHATMLVFPSIYEGFGLPPLEAMACGTPTITSFTSSLPEVTNGVSIMIDPMNVVDLSRAIQMLIYDKKLAESLRKKGMQQAKKFAWRKTAKQTKNVFDGIK